MCIPLKARPCRRGEADHALPCSLRMVFGFVFAALVTTTSPAVAAECTTTGLVFAIDASGSIDDAEYSLQMNGLASALSHPDVVATIAATGGLSAAAVVWSDAAVGSRTISWQTIRGAADAARFANAISSLPREGTGNTDLGEGIWEALDLLEDPALCVERRVVDVSGDGRETVSPRRRIGVSIFAARKRAEAMGVTLNGLVITDEEPDIATYYQDRVASGPRSFVLSVASFDDFEPAMRNKLIREIGTPALSLLDTGNPEGVGP